MLDLLDPEIEMAKARDPGKRPARRRAQPDAEPPKKTVGIRSTLEWADWLERAADFCRTDVAKLVDASLVEYLKARGFDEPPPPRL